MSGRIPIAKTDELDILSGVWIMSCNDDNPIMTYKSVTQRLNLPEAYDIKSLVRSRPELFRLGILNSRLNAWKDLMKTGKSRPNWIVEICDQEKQREAIESISRDDVFRNQFRIDDRAEKCDIGIIDWGLQHIERLRKAAAEEREARSKLWTSIAIPLASIFVAGLSIASSAWLQRFSMSEQATLKHYEVDFVPKQRGYSNFMLALDSVVSAVGERNKQELVMQMERMNSAFYSLEPFLREADREETRQEYLRFLDLCDEKLKQAKAEPAADVEAFLTRVVSAKRKLKDLLFANLFH